MAASACGSSESGGSGSKGSEVKFKTYSDKTYGFSFQYPEDWRVQEGNSAEITAGSNAKTAVGVFDPRGTKVNDIYIDLMQLALYELNATIDETMMPLVKPELENVLAQLEAQSADMERQGDLTQTTVNGLTGFMVTYTFSQDGEPATSTLYFLFAGNREYQLTCQSATSNWQENKPLFDAIVKSFQPGAAR